MSWPARVLPRDVHGRTEARPCFPWGIVRGRAIFKRRGKDMATAEELEKRKKHYTSQDRRGAVQHGIDGERRFAYIAKNVYCIPLQKATREENANMHIDFWRLFPETKIERVGIDVKAIRRVHGQSSQLFQDKLTWLEFAGTERSAGWLYGSRAEFLAFELKDCFIIVKREEVLAKGEELVNLDMEPIKKEIGVEVELNLLYTRPASNDLIAPIGTEHLYQLPTGYKKWDKPEHLCFA